MVSESELAFASWSPDFSVDCRPSKEAPETKSKARSWALCVLGFGQQKNKIYKINLRFANSDLVVHRLATAGVSAFIKA